jgi:hypothetical protein
MLPGQTLAYPKIGAGLAKGDWSIIASIIEEELAGEDHTLVEYEPEALATHQRNSFLGASSTIRQRSIRDPP